MSSWLAEVVRSEGGRITFERFMELALYHPVHGYYTGHVSAIGRSGDFSTATTIGDSLVRSVASWLKAEAKQLSMPVPRVIELGGGTGRLAAGILRSFMPWQRIRYRIVEISSTLRDVQERELRGKTCSMERFYRSGFGGRPKGEAILISNEFVDAFPCQRFERGAQRWKEIFLGSRVIIWREEYSESSSVPASSTFAVEFRDRSTSRDPSILPELAHSIWAAIFAAARFSPSITAGRPEEIYHRRPGRNDARLLSSSANRGEWEFICAPAARISPPMSILSISRNGASSWT